MVAVIVGTKADLASRRTVSPCEAQVCHAVLGSPCGPVCKAVLGCGGVVVRAHPHVQALAEELGVRYVETSALTSENVTPLFAHVGRAILAA